MNVLYQASKSQKIHNEDINESHDRSFNLKHNWASHININTSPYFFARKQCIVKKKKKCKKCTNGKKAHNLLSF